MNTENEIHENENLQPGDKLPNETVMCERLNVGRSSLREAMRALASRNVITIRQGSGSYVSASPGMIDDPLGLTFIEDKQKMIKDLMEIRFLIEPSIAAMAAIRADESDIKNILTACENAEKFKKKYNIIMQIATFDVRRLIS